MQSKSPILEDLANLMANAAGAMRAAGEEAKTAMRGQASRFAAEMDLVPREELEALKARVAALEAKLAEKSQ